ncbi:S1 RNA-binding domain-containing protein [Spiroplasma endosymbiont of Stenodema calcarata]|uniref:S1 RNA-binding domain-containing protein n=1 Tax=Spiroplasma endosymbiont of Stenodema calcarata TaxID=3139328 RepID=UPI003CCB367B
MYDKGTKIIVKITNITPFGAFCELKDAAGLIHISEFSDFFVRDIKEFVNVGDSVEVEVLEFDSVKKQVKLSYKNCRPELLKKNNSQIQEIGAGFQPLREKINSLTNE